jgi:hypothetical protein
MEGTYLPLKVEYLVHFFIFQPLLRALAGILSLVGRTLKERMLWDGVVSLVWGLCLVLGVASFTCSLPLWLLDYYL